MRRSEPIDDTGLERGSSLKLASTDEEPKMISGRRAGARPARYCLGVGQPHQNHQSGRHSNEGHVQHGASCSPPQAGSTYLTEHLPQVPSGRVRSTDYRVCLGVGILLPTGMPQLENNELGRYCSLVSPEARPSVPTWTSKARRCRHRHSFQPWTLSGWNTLGMPINTLAVNDERLFWKESTAQSRACLSLPCFQNKRRA